MAERTPDILIVTTDFIEGRPVKQHLGMVSAQAILGANVVNDLWGALKDVFTGRSGGYERFLARARAEALKSLADEAYRMGANAVVGVDLDYHTIGPKGETMMVAVNGSAVVLSEAARAPIPRAQVQAVQ